MALFKYKGLLTASLHASAVLITPHPADAQLNTLVDGNDGKLPTPPGLFLTPTAPLTSAIQQALNPGLASYPNYVAGELDFLARWKGNQYYFYNEDSINLSGYPLLNPQARFSKEQVRRFVAYARDRHVDIVPCLELYGHQHDLFRIEKYSSLADFPHGGEFDPANQKAQSTLAEWSKQYIDLFPSAFVHIGFDEPWEIARAARAKGSGYTPARLFLTQLRTVAQPFLANNKFVLAWGDVMVKFPDIASQLPANIAAVPWWYEPDPDPLYTKWLQPLASHHVPLFVATGVNMWSEMTPDFEKTSRNIDTFISAGGHVGALGTINTMWTDNQEALRRMVAGNCVRSFGCLADETHGKAELLRPVRSKLYPVSSAEDVASALKELSASESLAQTIWGTEDMDAQWSSPFAPRRMKALRCHRDDLRQMRLLAEQAQTQLMKALANGGDPATLNSLLFGSWVLDYAGMRGIYALELADLWERQKKASGRDAELWDLLQADSHAPMAASATSWIRCHCWFRTIATIGWPNIRPIGWRRPSSAGTWNADSGGKLKQASLNSFG